MNPNFGNLLIVVCFLLEELEIKIKYWSPAVMVIGSDWKSKKVIGLEYAGKVDFFDRIEDYSTTKLLKTI